MRQPSQTGKMNIGKCLILHIYLFFKNLPDLISQMNPRRPTNQIIAVLRQITIPKLNPNQTSETGEKIMNSERQTAVKTVNKDSKRSFSQRSFPPTAWSNIRMGPDTFCSARHSTWWVPQQKTNTLTLVDTSLFLTRSRVLESDHWSTGSFRG